MCITSETFTLWFTIFLQCLVNCPNKKICEYASKPGMCVLQDIAEDKHMWYEICVNNYDTKTTCKKNCKHTMIKQF